MVEGARLESVFTGDRNAGSNPALSAKYFELGYYLVKKGNFGSHLNAGAPTGCPKIGEELTN